VIATGKDLVSPLIGLTNDQTEFYNLARDFADNEMKPYAGKHTSLNVLCIFIFLF
jgi:hypothetical protein